MKITNFAILAVLCATAAEARMYTMDELSKKLCYAELVEVNTKAAPYGFSSEAKFFDFVKASTDPSNPTKVPPGRYIRTTVGFVYENNDSDILGIAFRAYWKNFNIGGWSAQSTEPWIQPRVGQPSYGHSVWSGYPSYSNNPYLRYIAEGRDGSTYYERNGYYNDGDANLYKLQGSAKRDAMNAVADFNSIFYHQSIEKLSNIWVPNDYSFGARFYTKNDSAPKMLYHREFGSTSKDEFADRPGYVGFSGKMRKCKNAPSYYIEVQNTQTSSASEAILPIDSDGGYVKVVNANYPEADSNQGLYTMVAGNSKFKNRVRLAYFDNTGKLAKPKNDLNLFVDFRNPPLGGITLESILLKNSNNLYYDNGAKIGQNTPIVLPQNKEYIELLLDTSEAEHTQYTFLVAAADGSHRGGITNNSDAFAIKPKGIKVDIEYNSDVNGNVQWLTAGRNLFTEFSYEVIDGKYKNQPYFKKFKIDAVGVDGKIMRGYSYSSTKARFKVKDRAPAGCFSNPVTKARMDQMESIEIYYGIGQATGTGSNFYSRTSGLDGFRTAYYDYRNPSGYKLDAGAVYSTRSRSGLTYPEVGHVSVTLDDIDKEFTKIDAVRGECIPNSTSTEPVGGKVGCDVAVKFDAYIGYVKPYSVMPINVRVYGYGSEIKGYEGTNFTYLSSDGTMSASVAFDAEAVALDSRTDQVSNHSAGGMPQGSMYNEKMADRLKSYDYTNKDYVTKLFSKDCYAEDLRIKFDIGGGGVIRKTGVTTDGHPIYGNDATINNPSKREFTMNEPARRKASPETRFADFFQDDKAGMISKEKADEKDNYFIIKQEAFLNGVLKTTTPVPSVISPKDGAWMRFNFRRDNRWEREPFAFREDLVQIQGSNIKNEFPVVANKNTPIYSSKNILADGAKFYYGRVYMSDRVFYNVDKFEHNAYYMVYCKTCDKSKFGIEDDTLMKDALPDWYTVKMHKKNTQGNVISYSLSAPVIAGNPFTGKETKVEYKGYDFFEDMLKVDEQDDYIAGVRDVDIYASSWLIYGSDPTATTNKARLEFFIKSDWGGQLFLKNTNKRYFPQNNELEEKVGSSPELLRKNRRIDW